MLSKISIYKKFITQTHKKNHESTMMYEYDTCIGYDT